MTDDLRQLLADATTAGPWDVHELYTRDEYVVCGGEDAYAVGTVWSYPDAELIAALRNQAPALLSALDRVTAERDAARLEAEKAHAELRAANIRADKAQIARDRLRRTMAGLTRWADGEERDDVPVGEIVDALMERHWEDAAATTAAAPEATVDPDLPNDYDPVTGRVVQVVYAAAPQADPSCVCTVDIRDGRIIDREASCPQHGAAVPGDGEQAATTSRWRKPVDDYLAARLADLDGAA